jgi:hypothetical protein
VLPALEPIGPSEERELLLERIGEWRFGREEDKWSRADMVPHGIDWIGYDQHAVAELELPAPPWTLSGKLRMNRAERVATRSLLVVLRLENGRGILLEQSTTDDAVRLSASLGQREASGWVAGEQLPELSFEGLAREAYRDAAPVSFEISWSGELLALEWGLDSSKGAPPPKRTELTLEDLRELGFPVGLGLELDSGSASLSEFFLRGR